jgi:hypothetical protein
MKKKLYYIILQYFLLIITTFCVPHQTNAAIVVSTTEGQKISLYDYSYALVVGNCTYQNFDNLHFACQDAEEVATVLKRKGFDVQLEINLTRAKFDTIFTDFALNRGKKENARMLFYYAGHGATLPMAGKEKMGYLVMIDTPKPDEDRTGFETRSIDMQYLVLKCKKMMAMHVLYMFDSCFSGSILNFREQTKPSQITHRVKYPVRQFITAGSENEPVPDKSFFKQIFLDLIEGRVEEPFKDGYITGEELGNYMKYKVPYYFSYQHPQFGKIKSPHLDKGDFVFLAGGVTIIEEPDVARNTGSIKIKIDVNHVPGMKISIYNVNNQRIYHGKDRIVNLSPGKYTIQITAPGFKNEKKQVFVNKDRKTRLSFVLEPLEARIYVAAEPSEARIRILRISPKFKQGMVLAPGRYELEATCSGYHKLNKWVTLNANEDLTVEMKLHPKLVVKQESQKTEKRIQTTHKINSFTNLLGMTFLLIPKGSFMMGSPVNELGREDDEKQHQVSLTHNYYMQTTEVTQGQWQAIMGTNPSNFKNCGIHCPVERVSWKDVQNFIDKLNKMDRERTYRLPTEFEWEYAARAGTRTRFFGETSQIVYKQTMEMGGKKMLG